MTRATLLVLGYAAITAVVVSPIIDFHHLSSASYEGDARLLIWTLAWDAHAILTGTPLFDANIYFPEPHALRYAEHHIGIGVFAVPIYAATANPVLTYWILWLAAFPLNALSMHALAWRMTRDHLAAFTAGCVYAFCFFRMHHAHGHIQLLWTWMLPLVPLALDRWLARPIMTRAATAGAVIVLAALTSGYLAVFVALLAIVSAAFVCRWDRVSRTHLRQALVAGTIAGLIVGWFTRPYLGLIAGPVAEVHANSADIWAYVVPPENTWLGQMLLRHTHVVPRWIWGEQTLYVGAAVLTWSLIGARRFARLEKGPERNIALAVVVTGIIALSFSFGPGPGGLAPFDLLSRVPGLTLLRAPARFALLVMMAAALMSAYGVQFLRQRYRRSADYIVAALLGVFFLESFVVAFPAGKPRTTIIPEAYFHLATLPEGPLLSLPTYRGRPEAFRETDYLLFSTAHWNRMVNGFGRQEPAGHAERMARLATFPSQESTALMRELGIRYVVVHTKRGQELPPAWNEAAVRLIHSADGDFLFEVR